jgi:hypothetical protein
MMKTGFLWHHSNPNSKTNFSNGSTTEVHQKRLLGTLFSHRVSSKSTEIKASGKAQSSNH